MLSCGCWIHGEEKSGGKRYPLIDPATAEVFGQSVDADAKLVDEALESAREGFNGWRMLPVARRADLLHALARRLCREVDELADLLRLEVGKPLKAARDEVLKTATHLDYFAEESRRQEGRIPLLGNPREQVLIVREPVGVVAAITPYNYPLSTLACKLAPALAVGCSVVAKPDEHTPLSTVRFARLASEEGFPPGVFNVITGFGPGAGRLLVNHPLPRLVTFTGSTETGKEILAVCSKYVRKAVMELGGNCPAIICADAPWRDILPQVVLQSLKNSGQYCYRIGRLYVAEEIADAFLGELTRHLDRLRMGPPGAEDTDLGPLNHQEALLKVRAQVAEALSQGARLEYRSDLPGNCGRGFYHPVTVLSGVTPEMSIFHQEVFGPVLSVVSFKDVPEAIRSANSTSFGLAAYLFSGNLANALDWAGQIEAGSVWINRIHQAYQEAPFGGMKESGLGREKSRYGLEEYTELKTLYVSY